MRYPPNAYRKYLETPEVRCVWFNTGSSTSARFVRASYLATHGSQRY